MDTPFEIVGGGDCILCRNEREPSQALARFPINQLKKEETDVRAISPLTRSQNLENIPSLSKIVELYFLYG